MVQQGGHSEEEHGDYGESVLLSNIGINCLSQGERYISGEYCDIQVLMIFAKNCSSCSGCCCCFSCRSLIKVISPRPVFLEMVLAMVNCTCARNLSCHNWRKPAGNYQIVMWRSHTLWYRNASVHVYSLYVIIYTFANFQQSSQLLCFEYCWYCVVV